MDIQYGNCLELIPALADGSVQTVYVDPPFNSGRNYALEMGSDVGFGDKWTDESYKEFVESLVDACLPKLKKDGSFFFHISTDQMWIPEQVLRAKFNHVRPIFWKRCRSKNNVKKTLGAAVDIVFWCYQLEKRKFNMVYQALDEYYSEHSFTNKDERGAFALGHIVPDRTRTGNIYPFTIEGRTFNPERGWRMKQEELRALADDNRLYVPKGAKANLYKKIYKDESLGKPALDLWDDIPSIAQGAEVRNYPTAKPIKLLERILSMTTNENDLVLDPCGGSGTTGAAALALGRRCVLMDTNPQAIEIMRARCAPAAPTTGVSQPNPAGS
jgi:site-specific DNA-methyltransferase (adenine-specific)